MKHQTRSLNRLHPVLLVCLTIILSIYATIAFTQEADTAKQSTVKQGNLLKFGGVNQIDVIALFKQDIGYDYGYYYYDPISSVNGGPFVSFEHIWEFKNKTALSIEPKAGANFRNSARGLYTGIDLNLYWINKEIFRMGMATSFTYKFIIRSENISYYDNYDGYGEFSVDQKWHLFDWGIALIPFQFRAKNAPLVIQMKTTFIGMGIARMVTQPYETPSGETIQFDDTMPYPYFLKTEFSIGFKLP